MIDIICQTNNVAGRLLRHNNGYVKSTKAYVPWEIVYSEARELFLLSSKSVSFLLRLNVLFV